MRALIAIPLLAALAACGGSIQSANEDQVSIRYNNFRTTSDSIRAMAESHCASHERHAVYRRTTLGGTVTGLPITVVYDCRESIDLTGVQMQAPDTTEPAKPAEAAKTAEPTKTAEPAKPTEPAKLVAAEGPKFAIHLSSLRDKAGVEKEWLELKAKYANLLAGQELIVRSVEVPEKGSFFRVLSGPFDSWAEAEDLCAGFEARDRYCQPVELEPLDPA